MKCLYESSLDVTSFSEQEKYLTAEQSGLLRRIVVNNKIKLIFSVSGIMEIEKELGVIDEIGLLNFIQKKYFDLDESSKNLNANEKAVLFGLITMHCFTNDRAINLETEETQDVWYRLLNESVFPFLQIEGIIAKSESLLSASTGNEHPANYLMRRQNALSKKTAGIFSNPGRNTYFLDLALSAQNETTSLLSYLFKLILPERISFEIIDHFKKQIEFTFRDYVPIIHGEITREDNEWGSNIKKSLDRVLLS